MERQEFLERRKRLRSDLSKIDTAVSKVDRDIADLVQKKNELESQRKLVADKLSELENDFSANQSSQNGEVKQDNEYAKFLLPQEWDDEVDMLLQNMFGLPSFRPLQREVINCTLQNQDCFVIVPSGGGKSLMYQLAALVKENTVTVVISPLIALMQDQVYHLTQLGIEAVFCTGSKEDKEQEKLDLARLIDRNDPSPISLIYVSPEKLVKNKSLQNKIAKVYQQGRLARIVIDEAHCCSEWGHDFRPAYKKLRLFRDRAGLNFSDVPILAVTATATDQVRDDVVKILRMQRPQFFQTSFNRPNLIYEVRPKSAKLPEEMAQLINSDFQGQSGLIYCRTRKECTNLHDKLKDLGLYTLCYHGGMKREKRTKVLKNWIKGKYKIVIATIAFGLGINKTNVRFVFHNSLSKNIQNYYQESGRAGRDGNESRCIVWYRPTDVIKQMTMTAGSNFDYADTMQTLKMVSFFTDGTKCRRATMSRFFGEHLTKHDCKKMCDVCRMQAEGITCVKTLDCLPLARMVAKILKRFRSEKITLPKMVKLVRGNKVDGKLMGVLEMLDLEPLKGYSADEVTHMIMFLLTEEFIAYEFYTTAHDAALKLTVGRRTREVSNDYGLGLSTSLSSLTLNLFSSGGAKKRRSSVASKRRSDANPPKKRKRRSSEVGNPNVKKRKTSKKKSNVIECEQYDEEGVAKDIRKVLGNYSFCISDDSDKDDDDEVIVIPPVKKESEKKPQVQKPKPVFKRKRNKSDTAMNFSKKESEEKSHSPPSENSANVPKKKRSKSDTFYPKFFGSKSKRKFSGSSSAPKACPAKKAKPNPYSDAKDPLGRLKFWRSKDIDRGAIMDDVLIKISENWSNIANADEDLGQGLVTSLLGHQTLSEKFWKSIFSFIKGSAPKKKMTTIATEPFKKPRLKQSKLNLDSFRLQRPKSKSLPVRLNDDEDLLMYPRPKKKPKRRYLNNSDSED